MDNTIVMSDLQELLKKQQQIAGGLRALARKVDVSHTAIKNVIENNDAIPELETLVKFARAFKLPLWRVVEMAGFDLELNQGSVSQAQRLASLMEVMPQYRPVVDYLLRLNPDDIEGMLMYLEVLERQRQAAA